MWLLVNLIKEPQDFFTVFLIGLTTGLVYALVALGYTLVYGILQLINFAHGDVFALTGLFASTMILTRLRPDRGSRRRLMIVLGLAATLLIVVAVRRDAEHRDRAGRLPPPAARRRGSRC